MYKKQLILICIILAASSLTLSAGGAKELVLDDTWEVSKIETEEIITKDLQNWLDVYFDADSNTARIPYRETYNFYTYLTE